MYNNNNVEIDSNFVSRFYQECFQDTKKWDSGVQCCVGPTSNCLSNTLRDIYPSSKVDSGDMEGSFAMLLLWPKTQNHS